MPPENVKVAVLVRPFTDREKDEDCSCIVEAQNGEIKVHNTELDKAKDFNFDFSVSYLNLQASLSQNDLFQSFVKF